MPDNYAAAIAAYDEGQFRSIRATARHFEVNHATLARRIKGCSKRMIIYQQQQKLSLTEEATLEKTLLEYDARGLSCSIAYCQDLANQLLQKREAPPVGKCWASRFIQRHPQLKARYTRSYDYQRARAEDPESIQQWVDLVESKIQQFGITADDIYNVDETGFLSGCITASGKVITAAKRRARRVRRIQPGDRTWVTVVECINGTRTAIPPLIIFPGKSLTDEVTVQPLPYGWMFTESDKGWTSDDISLRWLKEVYQPATQHCHGLYRMLILDGHGSHLTPEFSSYCEEQKIVLLCMPAHSSHLLQPLDVGIFAVLKRAYGEQLKRLCTTGSHVTKHDFIAAYAQARLATFSATNITSAWRATGLIPIDAQHVIDKLTVVQQKPRLLTTTPERSLSDNSSQLATPVTVRQINKLTVSTKKRLSRGQLGIAQRLDKLLKSTETLRHELTVMSIDNALLTASTKQPRRYQKGRILSQGNIINSQQLEERQSQLQNRDNLQDLASAALGGSTLRLCGICKEPGHTKRTCEKRFI